ncbi:MAG: hypothetical protein JWO67_4892 [Streptosporangiaceae bacterium]|nr:hypothetical protein [Streptosporangiaceae bacterium]
MGEWFPIPDPPYWRYDDQAPDADPSVTSMLPVYAAGDVAPVIAAGSAEPPDGDAQSDAYRGMTADDIVPDSEIAAYAAHIHQALPEAAHPASHLLLPEDYEREQWDTGREDPR